MATYEYNDKVKFILPDDFFFTREEDDEGDEICGIYAGKYEDEDGETVYRFKCQMADIKAPADKTNAGEIFDGIVENQDNAKCFKVPGTPYSMFFTSAQPLIFLGHIVKQFFLISNKIALYDVNAPTDLFEIPDIKVQQEKISTQIQNENQKKEKEISELTDKLNEVSASIDQLNAERKNVLSLRYHEKRRLMFR